MSTALWQFVKPEAATNLITNPSFETNTTGWTAGSGSLARSNAQQAVGVYSGGYTPAAGTTDGLYYAITLATSTTYTFSVSVRGVNGIPYRLRIRNQSNGVDVGSNVNFTGTGNWQRQVITFTTSSTGTSYRLFIEKNGSASTGVFYVDAAQLEQAAYATTYCDGSQEDCVWAGTAHASTSTRAVTTAAGGRVTDITNDNQYMLVKDHTGVGAPLVDIIDSLPAQGDGGDYQATRHRPRFFSLIGQIIGYDAGNNNDAMKSNYHQKRRNLITAFLPHRLPTDQPVRVRYKWLTRQVELKAFYQNGLEKGAFLNAVMEDASLGFKAEFPFYKRVMGTANGDWGADQGGAALTVRQSVSNANRVLQRSAAGVWSALSTGAASGGVYALVKMPDQSLIIAGNFTGAGGVADTDGIARWNGSAWSALGTGVSSGTTTFSALAVMPNGDLIFGGAFAAISGVADTDGIARWNGSAWSALGTGVSSGTVHVMALAVMPNGDLIAGGRFSAMGGVANTSRIARWDGSAWSALGTGISGGLGEVRALAVMPNGDLIAAGDFATAGGVSCSNIARWNGSAWSALGSGLNGSAYALAAGLDGSLYAGGFFSAAGGVSCSNIARWNGSAWSALGSGLDAQPWALAIAPDGTLIAGGAFDFAGGVPVSDGIARWSGSAWTTLADVVLPATNVQAILFNGDELTVGFDGGGSAVTGVSNTITYNGDTWTYPTLTMSGPGRIYSLINYTTGKAIYFNLLLVSGETAVLTFDPEILSFISSSRGNLLAQGAILGGSDHDNFYLAPGSNSLSLFINDASAAAVLTWDELFYSFDGVV